MTKRSEPSAKPTATYQEEALLLGRGLSRVAGVDEAGRGSLAGPVVAGAAILPPNPTGEWVSHIRDSKEMTPRQRARSMEDLTQRALSIASGLATAEEIDDVGIVHATQLAMERAVGGLRVRPDYLLLDAVHLPDLPLPQKSIIDGDALCISIAAGSIVAKVTRDRIMETQDARYRLYGFARHKGYATLQHLHALKRLGPCAIHRYSFAPVRQSLPRQ